MRHYFLKYSDKIKAGFGGCATGPFIKIRPKYQHDKGLLLHEIEHVNQWWRAVIYCVVCAVLLSVAGLSDAAIILLVLAPSAHGILYRFSRRYRLNAEVAAYRRQIQYYGPLASNRFAIEALVNKYNLKLTYHMARALLAYRY